jgi:hypothetical protein
VYLLPLNRGELQADGSLLLQPPGTAAPHQPRGTVNKIKPSVLDVRILDGMLRKLEGRSISYGSFARDTRPERSRYETPLRAPLEDHPFWDVFIYVWDAAQARKGGA